MPAHRFGTGVSGAHSSPHVVSRELPRVCSVRVKAVSGTGRLNPSVCRETRMVRAPFLRLMVRRGSVEGPQDIIEQDYFEQLFENRETEDSKKAKRVENGRK